MDRCPACPNRFKCIPGDGPERCDILFIGEAPGKDEEHKGRIFIGKTGQEYDRGYLPFGGLRRPNVRTVNAIRCFPDRPGGKLEWKNEKDRALMRSCTEHFLYAEIERCRPKTIVPMGTFAARALDDNIDIELQWGFPLQTSMGTVFPMYHPTYGIHDAKKMLQIRQGWVRLRHYLAGTLRLPVDEYAGREDYGVIITADDVMDYLWDYRKEPLGNDTETLRGGAPFCLTISRTPGTGKLIKADNLEALEAMQYCLDHWEGDLLWHNWAFDYGVTTDMGLAYNYKRIKDTMQAVARLGNQKQGLKWLSYRHLGMDMQDFDDLVTPYSREKVIDFYRLAKTEEWPKPLAQKVRDDKTGEWKDYKPHSFTTKLKTFFTYLDKNPDKDVFEAWTKNWEEEHEMVEERIGRWPGKCISHAPFTEALHYACRDADALLRLYPKVKQAVRNVRRKPEWEWFNEMGETA